LALANLHYYVLADAGPRRPRRVRNLLVIIDTCFAGKGTIELASQFRRVLWRISGGSIYLLGAALPDEEARAGALAEALTESVQELLQRNVTQEYLFLEELMPMINKRLEIHQAICTAVSVERQQFFPKKKINFLDTHGRPVPAHEAQRAIVDQEFREHWGPRSRGVEFDNQPGSYFSGRKAVLDELADFFKNPADNRTRVVTGQPGAGKSAILSRVVTLSTPRDPAVKSAEFAGTFFAPVHIAIHAKGKSLGDISDRIAGTLAVDPNPEIILAALRQSTQPTRIVVDALDEASEPSVIAHRLLRPMGAIDSVKLLIGTRQSYIPALGDAEVIDIDKPRYAKNEDIASYVKLRLLRTDEPGQPTPYARKDGQAEKVAKTVSQRAYPNFLVARLLTEDLLARRDAVDPDSLTEMTLPRKVPAAFDAYLARFGDKEIFVRDLLMPLAYAEGAGLPWDDIWAPVASALSKRKYDDPDIRWLLQNAGAFVLESAEEGHTVYRLFHRTLADALRSGQKLQSAQRRISKALIASVPHLPGEGGREWLVASRYVRSHLATHAAAAGQLDKLVADPLFLVAARPGPLLHAFSRVKTAEARQVRKIYKMAAHQWVSDGSLAEWVSYLELTARQNGADKVAGALASLPIVRRWKTRWAYFDATIPHRVLRGHEGPVRAVAVCKDTVISAGDDGAIRLWEIETGAPVGDPLRGHEGAVLSLYAGVIDGREVILSGSDDGTLKAWSINAGAELLPMQAHQGAVNAIVLAKINKLPVIFSAGSDGTIRFWSAASGDALREPLRAHKGAIRALVFCELKGIPTLISTGDGEVIRVWNAVNSNLMKELVSAERSRGHFLPIDALACLPTDNSNRLVSGGHDGRVQQWDLTTGQTISLPIKTDHTFVAAICCPVMHAQQIIVTGGLDGKIQAWNASTQEALGPPVAGHDKNILALAAGRAHSGSVVVSGGMDQTVRLWDLEALAEEKIQERFSQVSEVWSVAASGSRVASRSYDRRIRLFEAAGGKAIWEIEADSDAFRRGLALSEVGDETLLAFNANGIRLYKLSKESFEASAPIVFYGEADTLLFYTREGQTLLTAISATGEVISWDVSTRVETAHTWLDLHRGWRDLPEQWIDTLAAGKRSDGRSIAVSGGSGSGVIRVWELHTGAVEMEIPLSTNADARVWSNSLAIGEVDGRTIVASGNSDGAIKLWYAEDAVLVGQQRTAAAVHAVQIGSLAGYPVVASGGGDHILRVWWPGTFDETVNLGCPVNAIAFGAESTIIAGTSRGIVAVRFAL